MSLVPNVHYAYHAGGVSRDGSVIRAGSENRGYSLEQQARDFLAKYSVGSKLPVRHHPQNPAMAAAHVRPRPGWKRPPHGHLIEVLGLARMTAST
jgi:hypothetical protein